MTYVDWLFLLTWPALSITQARWVVSVPYAGRSPRSRGHAYIITQTRIGADIARHEINSSRTSSPASRANTRCLFSVPMALSLKSKCIFNSGSQKHCWGLCLRCCFRRNPRCSLPGGCPLRCSVCTGQNESRNSSYRCKVQTLPRSGTCSSVAFGL